jgi:hypothetical protein
MSWTLLCRIHKIVPFHSHQALAPRLFKTQSYLESLVMKFLTEAMLKRIGVLTVAKPRLLTQGVEYGMY